jgi:putative phosphoesterase
VTRRVAALYDIHGNLPALEAALEDIRPMGVDQILVGGDVTLGPMPRETLACLLALPCPVRFIRGNCDRQVLARMSGEDAADVPERARGLVRWVAEQLGPEEQRRMSGWPLSLGLEIDGLGEVLFCHATPRGDSEVFTRLTPAERLRPVFESVTAGVVACGHTHMPFDRTVGGIRVVNAGSVGMPYGESGAHWLLLGPGVEPRRTAYDAVRAAARIRDTRYPDAERFATRHVLDRPSEAEMLEALRGVALG